MAHEKLNKSQQKDLGESASGFGSVRGRDPTGADLIPFHLQEPRESIGFFARRFAVDLSLADGHEPIALAIARGQTFRIDAELPNIFRFPAYLFQKRGDIAKRHAAADELPSGASDPAADQDVKEASK